MNVEKDIKRIKICVERMNARVDNSIKKENILAFNRIVELVLEKKEDLLKTNYTITKLYVILLGFQIEKYQASLSSKIPVKELHKQIDQPLEFLVQQLCTKANDMEQRKLFESLKIDISTHPAKKSKNTKLLETNKLAEAIKDEDNFKKLFCSYWMPDQIMQEIETNVLNII